MSWNSAAAVPIMIGILGRWMRPSTAGEKGRIWSGVRNTGIRLISSRALSSLGVRESAEKWWAGYPYFERSTEEKWIINKHRWLRDPTISTELSTPRYPKDKIITPPGPSACGPWYSSAWLFCCLLAWAIWKCFLFSVKFTLFYYTFMHGMRTNAF